MKEDINILERLLNQLRCWDGIKFEKDNTDKSLFIGLNGIWLKVITWSDKRYKIIISEGLTDATRINRKEIICNKNDFDFLILNHVKKYLNKVRSLR